MGQKKTRISRFDILFSYLIERLRYQKGKFFLSLFKKWVNSIFFTIRLSKSITHSCEYISQMSLLKQPSFTTIQSNLCMYNDHHRQVLVVVDKWSLFRGRNNIFTHSYKCWLIPLIYNSYISSPNNNFTLRVFFLLWQSEKDLSNNRKTKKNEVWKEWLLDWFRTNAESNFDQI